MIANKISLESSYQQISSMEILRKRKKIKLRWIGEKSVNILMKKFQKNLNIKLEI